MSAESKLREAICLSGASLFNRGLTHGSTGNISVSLPDGGWLMSLECENCLDQTLTDGAVVGLPTLNPPRWWQLRFTQRF